MGPAEHLSRALRERDEALAFQAATREILASISGSIADTKPVFDAIVSNLLRLFGTRFATVALLRDGQLHLAALQGEPGYEWLAGGYPRLLDDRNLAGRVILSGRVMQVTPCIGNPAAPPRTQEVARHVGFNSIIAAPMICDARVVGAITTAHRDAVPFDEKQVALIKAFADQAVIAIENARLFNETRAALERQMATGEILSVIAGSPTEVQPVFDSIVRNAATLCGGMFANAFRYDGEQLHFVATSLESPEGRKLLSDAYPMRPHNAQMSGRAILAKAVVKMQDALADPEYDRRHAQVAGWRRMLGVPMLREGNPIGAIVVAWSEAGPIPKIQEDLLKSFADQAVIAIENVRLFKEIRDKSRQLEIANQHKSEFLANMSHELRTPLNAIIGFSEVLMERMFGEVNAKQAEYLKDIHESGRHLLSLINDILDLSKVEAGRMELELSSFHLPTALSNAMTLVRERAQRHGIALTLEADPRLGEFRADERKLKQILLNLLSNAVKFTPEGGRVQVSARLDADTAVIAVQDSGIGIAPGDQAKLFEEFRQVGGDSARKAEGTGLGLALTKRFVELHGGEIRVESAPGEGSTFTVRLPATSRK